MYDLCGSSQVWTSFTYVYTFHEFLSLQLSLGVKSCCFHAEIWWSFKDVVNMFSKIILLGGFLLYIKTLLPHPLSRPIFYLSTCLKSWHFGSCRMFLFEKEPLRTAKGICSCVQQRERLDLQLVLEWWWCGTCSVAVARNNCLSVVEGWTVIEHHCFCLKLILHALVSTPPLCFKLLSHLAWMLTYHKGSPDCLM